MKISCFGQRLPMENLVTATHPIKTIFDTWLYDSLLLILIMLPLLPLLIVILLSLLRFSLKHEMRRQGVIKQLCSLLTSVPLPDEMQYHVIDALSLLATNNSDNCEEIWWENGLTYLIDFIQVTLTSLTSYR